MQRYSKFLLTTHALRGLAYQSRKLHGTPDKSLALTVLITLNLSRWFLGWLTIYTPDTYLCKSSEPAGASDTHPRKSAARFHPPLRRQAESSPHLRTFYRTSIQIPYFSCDWDKWTFKKLLPSRQFLSRRHLCRVGPQAPAPCPRRRLSAGVPERQRGAPSLRGRREILPSRPEQRPLAALRGQVCVARRLSVPVGRVSPRCAVSARHGPGVR
ncbi:hypothetical protein B0H10DRAFT_299815 [Mycena sp. CBHHK59/15]|nr:hypothetical protein B0H10DRAFT_299815 [Mycena sp. CBHHK59/15]